MGRKAARNFCPNLTGLIRPTIMNAFRERAAMNVRRYVVLDTMRDERSRIVKKLEKFERLVIIKKLRTE